MQCHRRASSEQETDDLQGCIQRMGPASVLCGDRQYPPGEGKKLETAPRHRGARSPRASTAIWPEGFLTVASKPMPTTVSAAIPEVAIAYNVTKERLGGGQGSRGGDCRSCDSLNGPKEKGGGVKSMDRGSENLRDYHRRGKGS